jgi:hypothetical protein
MAPPPAPPKKGLSKLALGLIIGGVVFGSCGTVICIGVSSDNTPEEQKKRTEERKILIEKTTAQLVSIRNRWPAALAEKGCPDASIPEDAVAQTADFDSLERFTKPDVDPESPPFKSWAWLTSEGIRELKMLPQFKVPLHSWELGDMARSLESLQKGRYLVVFRADKGAKVMPTIQGDSAFMGGEFEGWAVVYDLQTEAAICQAPLKAESSDNVTRRKGLVTGKSPEEAIEQDFKEQFETAAKASLAKISKKLQSDL